MVLKEASEARAESKALTHLPQHHSQLAASQFHQTPLMQQGGDVAAFEHQSPSVHAVAGLLGVGSG